MRVGMLWLLNAKQRNSYFFIIFEAFSRCPLQALSCRLVFLRALPASAGRRKDREKLSRQFKRLSTSIGARRQ